jgi:rSAM/selenodomain-associated transferase 2
MIALVVLAPVANHLLWFSIVYCLCHILMILMVRFFPEELPSRQAFAVILILGILVRITYLPFPVANDVYRYVWEGYIQNLGFNPYQYAPLSPELAEIARGDLSAIWQQINHPEYTAIYPPAALLLFRALAFLNPNPYFFKAAMIGFDIGVMIVLVLLIKRLSYRPSRLLFYAANPLVIVFVSGEVHLDVVQVFFLTLALYLILSDRYPAAGFMFLGLAILSKFIALIALPFLIHATNRVKWLTVLLPLALYIPYMDAGPSIFHSLGAFGTDFHYNDALTVLIRYVFNDWHLTAVIVLLALCLLWVYFLVQDHLRSIYLALACTLLFLPTLHPWYLVLITPFLVFFPSRAWLYLSAASVFTFPTMAVDINTGVFQEIHWLKLFEYLPFYGMLLYGIFRNGLVAWEKTYDPPGSISVVVPTLNEADRLEGCLASLAGRTALKEIVVADGGSADNTAAIAAGLGARVVNSRKGRGHQIKNGIQVVSGDVVVILHADCIVQKGIFKKIITQLTRHPEVAGGAVGMQFGRSNPRTVLVAALNNLRTILTGISFGDQAQFFRSEALEAAGGFPETLLMEDIELALRLKTVGRLIFLGTGVSVSGRRWQGRGFSGKLMTVLYLFTRYLFERRFARGHSSNQYYYHYYYSEKNTP